MFNFVSTNLSLLINAIRRSRSVAYGHSRRYAIAFSNKSFQTISERGFPA
ncbi:MAG: hypothetical protein F6J90_13285 [Moorea sp. SIOASIH]|nr:hypothetical protein [Moorena sp. SIOASIH]